VIAAITDTSLFQDALKHAQENWRGPLDRADANTSIMRKARVVMRPTLPGGGGGVASQAWVAPFEHRREVSTSTPHMT